MRMTKLDEVVTISIIGAGNRAQAYMNAMKKLYPNKFLVKAIFDPKKECQDIFKQEFNVEESMIFDDYKVFLEMDRISDVVIIATLDDMHLEPTLAAIEKGYDIILEKPISISLKETIMINEKAKTRPNQLIAVCHVLRHSPFFVRLKEIVDSKMLGNVIDIQHNENVGYYHFSHSYVRGNWRNTDIAAPFIVAKSCHDMDILLYLLGDKHSVKLASYGNLTFFKKSNFNEKTMAYRCQDCSIEEKCPYSCFKIYGSGKIRSVVFNDSSVDALRKDLENSQYGRCVFKCDNDVLDHQVTIIEFEDGIHSTFNLSGFTNKIHRSIKIMCEYGEIRGTEVTNEIEIAPFGGEKTLIKVQKPVGGHGGADVSFIDNFMKTYIKNEPFNSTLEMSIESHIMAFAADSSQKNDGETIRIKDFYDKYKSKIEEE